MLKYKWSVTAGVFIIMSLMIAAGYILTKQDAGSVTVVSKGGSLNSIEDLSVVYRLNQNTQEMYSITVVSVAQAAKNNGTDQQVNPGDIFVSGRACNNMSGTIPLLPKGSTTDKKVVKTLDDGRIVLEPQIASTMMACQPTTPAKDDQALNKVFNDIAASLQSV
jgi:hypothetical protein